MAELLKLGVIEDGNGGSPTDEAVIYTNDNDDWHEITVEGTNAIALAGTIVEAVNNYERLSNGIREIKQFLETACPRVGDATFVCDALLASVSTQKEPS